MTELLSISGLCVEIPTSRGVARPVNDVSLSIGAGEMLGIVGESGSGKSMTAMSVLRMLPTPAARITAGQIMFAGENLVAASERRLRQIRGARVGTIFQEPLTALNPVLTIGQQLVEPLRRHQRLSRRAAHHRAVELIDMVGIRRPERAMSDYPFQLSGGQRQRVMIAMAMSCAPQLLIADEPTTALDVTTQAQILDLMVELQEQHGTAILLITHDLGVVAQSCQRVAVMHQGSLVETGQVAQLFAHPQADYTKRLLSFRSRWLSEPQQPGQVQSVGEDPRDAQRPDARLRAAQSGVASVLEHRQAAAPLLEVRDLVKHYRRGRGRWAETITAVDRVSFTVRAGQTLAIVGESGSGKSTTARAVLRLIAATSGSVRFAGREVLELGAEELRSWRSDAQIIFQDTYASLDPRWRIGDSLAEPLTRHTRLRAAERRDRVVESLELVGLTADHAARFPHEFSGGQRQRIGIARALVLRPKLVVADEPVSALDVSVQAQVLALMRDLQDRLGLAYLFITHDLSVVAEIADEVLVMHLGQVVERGAVSAVLREPQHPYTRALLAAVPPADPAAAWSRQRRRQVIEAGLAAAGRTPAAATHS